MQVKEVVAVPTKFVNDITGKVEAVLPTSPKVTRASIR